MAKGLRSKSMRKNRAMLRLNVVNPIIEKRQEKLAEKLKKSLEEKKVPTTLLSLKKVLPSASKTVEQDKVVADKSTEENAMDQEEEDEEEEEEEEVPKKKSKKQNPFQKPKAVKAAKPKAQKEMVWFK